MCGSREQPILIVGLTGGIGMGKTTVGKMLMEHGYPLLDADQIVHQLYAPGGAAVGELGTAFPGCIGADGGVDRAALSKCVVGNAKALKTLEGIVHPLVTRERQARILAASGEGADAIILDIPLLFETGAEVGCDVTVAVSVPQDVQRERVTARPGMTLEKLEALLKRQLSDSDRRSKADVVLDTGGTLEHTRTQVTALVATFPGRQRTAFNADVARQE